MIRRQTLWFAMLLGAMVALAPTLAEARAGGGSTSSGSRGARTHDVAPATPTAPQSQQMQRSVTPQSTQPARPAATPAGAPAAQPSFFQRNPFMAGMMGGLLGAGIGGMLFGGGFMGGGMGMAGGLGLLLQLALIGGLAYLAYSIWRRRKDSPATESNSNYAYATADDRGPWAAQQARQIPDVAPIDIATGRSGGGVAPMAATAVRDEIGVKESDYAEFEKLLVSIQKAWSEGEVGALRRHLTPEMLSYFSEHLSRNVSAGIENRVEDVKFETGDLAEAWAEGDLQYATVAMKWTARDYTLRTDTGIVTEGSKTERGEAIEVWTFVRAPGGRWLLSAIQQV